MAALAQRLRLRLILLATLRPSQVVDKCPEALSPESALSQARLRSRDLRRQCRSWISSRRLSTRAAVR
jgi:hypothetical protein